MNDTVAAAAEEALQLVQSADTEDLRLNIMSTMTAAHLVRGEAKEAQFIAALLLAFCYRWLLSLLSMDKEFRLLYWVAV